MTTSGKYIARSGFQDYPRFKLSGRQEGRSRGTSVIRVLFTRNWIGLLLLFRIP